jgi:hypothetical protein
MKSIAIITFVVFYLMCPGVAHALYFDGGFGDGTALAIGDSRSWGFFGGPGRGEATIMTATQTLMTFTSTEDQTFFLYDPATSASNILVRQDTAIGPGVTDANNLRIVIPSGLAMSWDTTLTTVTLGGSAAGKVSTTVSYPDSKTLLLDVTADFVDGDAVTVSGLKFTNFTATAPANFLRLDIAGSGLLYEIDPFYKLLFAHERAAGFLGGSGRGEVEGDIYLLPRNAVDMGTLF